MEIKVKAELICEFDNFQRWVNKAGFWLKGFKNFQIVCVCSDGYIAHIGEDFMKADKEGKFPIRCYRLVRQIENK